MCGNAAFFQGTLLRLLGYFFPLSVRVSIPSKRQVFTFIYPTDIPTIPHPVYLSLTLRANAGAVLKFTEGSILGAKMWVRGR